MNRDEFKLACLRILNGVAAEHPVGHQGKLAARYLLRKGGGDTVELMFEKGPTSSPNLWLCRQHLDERALEGIDHQLSPAASLYQTVDTAGKSRYGRHSALKPMRQLANADLVCVQLRTLGELERILGRLTADRAVEA